jgi:hypothetical protein
MPLLIDDPRWTLEHTDNGLFFVTMRYPLESIADLDEFMGLVRPHLHRLAPVLYLNDATHIQGSHLKAQWRLAEHMKRNAPYIRKSALFGVTPVKAFMVRAVVRAAGRDNVRVFDDRAGCEQWLLAP